MIPVYSNGAVSKLTNDITAVDTTIVVDDASAFPSIVPGTEYFTMTLVGNLVTGIEIVQVNGVDGSSLTVVRGFQGTTPASFLAKDQAYHGITSDDAGSFRDAMEYYLDPAPIDPTTGRYGQPLKAGMLYYNVNNQIMREYTGSQWKQFATVLSLSGLSEFMWASHDPVAAGGLVEWPDDTGKPKPDIDNSNDLVQVYIDGLRLQQNGNGVVGDYNVITGTPGDVQLIAEQASDFEMTIVFGVPDDNDYIDRDESDASGYGFVDGDHELGGSFPSAALLPTQAAVKGYVDDTPKGSSNAIVNGDFRVDQRGFESSGYTWATLPNNDFGYDRWQKKDIGYFDLPPAIRQTIENQNVAHNETYILSWDGGGTGGFVGGNEQGPASTSPVVGLMTAGPSDPFVEVPITATNIRFERGERVNPRDVRPIQQELALCQRYYNEELIVGAANYVDGAFAAGVRLSFQFPPMRVSPNVIFTTIDSGNTSGGPVLKYKNDRSAVYDVASAGAGRTLYNAYVKLDAEIT